MISTLIMVVIGKVGSVPNLNIHISLFFLENQENNMDMKMGGTILMFLLTLEKDNQVIWSLLEVTWR
jgi:hypothetical protein